VIFLVSGSFLLQVRPSSPRFLSSIDVPIRVGGGLLICVRFGGVIE
jgi:hypothetical protein